MLIALKGYLSTNYSKTVTCNSLSSVVVINVQIKMSTIVVAFLYNKNNFKNKQLMGSDAQLHWTAISNYKWPCSRLG